MGDVELHGAEGIQVQGYLTCTCGTLVLEHVFHMTGGLCSACFAEGKTRKIRVAEVMHAGRRINLPAPRPRKRYGRGNNGNHGARKAAKLSALRRLGNLYPEMFAMLYAEERLKRGLAPVPRRVSEPVEARGAETDDWEAVYAALSEVGETSDGPS